MQNISPSAAKIIAFYYPLLSRYAARVTGDRNESEKIARNVLEEQYEINGLAPSKLLRVVLKTDVLNRAFYFKQQQIFNRPKIRSFFINSLPPEDNSRL